MTSSTLTASTEHTRLSTKNKVGLVLAGLLGVTDMASLGGPTPGPGEQGPPTAVLVAATILGVITIVAVLITWRTGSRVPARVVAGSRILSALTALPAFFVGGVPTGLIAAAAGGIVLTAIAVWLVLSRPA